MVVTLDSSFPDVLVKEEFSAQLVSTDPDSEYVPYDLYIHEVDDADKSLKIKFPGAPSG